MKKNAINNPLISASKLAKIAYHTPVLCNAFWDSYMLSKECQQGMSFWNFMVKRFADA
jgi:hypothetical protein